VSIDINSKFLTPNDTITFFLGKRPVLNATVNVINRNRMPNLFRNEYTLLFTFHLLLNGSGCVLQLNNCYMRFVLNLI
jgi:hypothetical protein